MVAQGRIKGYLQLGYSLVKKPVLIGLASKNQVSVVDGEDWTNCIYLLDNIGKSLIPSAVVAHDHEFQIFSVVSGHEIDFLNFTGPVIEGYGNRVIIFNSQWILVAGPDFKRVNVFQPDHTAARFGYISAQGNAWFRA